MMIPFNKPYLTGNELKYIQQAVQKGHISGNGYFTHKCQAFFETKYSFTKCLLTSSCTDALEMAALLIDIEPGDEVIIPTYTFVSTANAFVLRGATIKFADSLSHEPNIDPSKIEALISPRTKCIVVVHYAGVACDMDSIMDIAKKHKLFIIEDCAQGIDSFYKGKALGSFGSLATFSFHETKNIMCGEGGMLVINDESFIPRAEILWEKGTNRVAFSRGDIQRYNWVDIGSSFLPSEVSAAFLYAQLEKLGMIQNRRKKIWQYYYDTLKHLEQNGTIQLPKIPTYATQNGHLFYILFKNNETRDDLIQFLKKHDILAVFHYLCLHKSPFYKDRHDGRLLKNAENFEQRLLRLPLFFELSDNELKKITSLIAVYT